MRKEAVPSTYAFGTKHHTLKGVASIRLMPQPCLPAGRLSGWGLPSEAPPEHGPPQGRLVRWRAWAALGILSAAALTACDGGATEPPFLPEASPTPTAQATLVPEATPTAVPTPTAAPETPTPPPQSGDMDGFRAFAALIDAALADDDASFFADRGVEDEMTCAGDEQLGPCAGQPAGAVLTGIPGAAAQSDAFGLFTPADYAAMLRDWFANARPDQSDEYGSGGLALYALAHSPTDTTGEEAYLAIVTGIFTSGPDAFRQARILSFQSLDGSWRLTFELFATVPQTATDWLSGECADCYDHWERWEGTP